MSGPFSSVGGSLLLVLHMSKLLVCFSVRSADGPDAARIGAHCRLFALRSVAERATSSDFRRIAHGPMDRGKKKDFFEAG